MIFAEATVLQLDLTTAVAAAGAIGSGITGAAAAVAKLFTGYLRQRDEGWQQSLQSISAHVIQVHADNKELNSLIYKTMVEYAQMFWTIAGKANGVPLPTGTKTA